MIKFDYKIVIILALSFVIYYLYREIDDVKKKCKLIETKMDVPSIRTVSNNNVCYKPKQLRVQVPSTTPLFDNKRDELKLIKLDKNTVDIDEDDVPENLVKLPNSSCNLDESSTELDSDSDIDNEDEELVTSEDNNVIVYSNDNSEDILSMGLGDDLEIELVNIENVNFISDDEDEKKNLTSSPLLIEQHQSSPIEFPEVDIDAIVNEASVEPEFKFNKLRRKKVADIRQIAADLAISLNKVEGDKLKNKTKIELCNDIIAKKQI